MTKIVIRVRTIKGTCPVFEKGDKIVIDGASLVKEESDAYCVWAAMSFTPYLIAARTGIPGSNLGLSNEDRPYYVQCLDPGPPLTPGGTVTFEITTEP
jgi:uncharacterized repeat protein (TIGR04076 family)